jgi:hypothetical protein
VGRGVGVVSRACAGRPVRALVVPARRSACIRCSKRVRGGARGRQGRERGRHPSYCAARAGARGRASREAAPGPLRGLQGFPRARGRRGHLKCPSKCSSTAVRGRLEGRRRAREAVSARGCTAAHSRRLLRPGSHPPGWAPLHRGGGRALGWGGGAAVHSRTGARLAGAAPARRAAAKAATAAGVPQAARLRGRHMQPSACRASAAGGRGLRAQNPKPRESYNWVGPAEARRGNAGPRMRPSQASGGAARGRGAPSAARGVCLSPHPPSAGQARGVRALLPWHCLGPVHLRRWRAPRARLPVS